MLLLLRRRQITAFAALPLFLAGGVIGGALHGALQDRGLGVIVVDPGHGGIDGGCQDSRGNLEKELNLAVAQRLAANLAKAGHKSRLTREGDRALGETYDQDLQYRLSMADRGRTLALVSIHANWFQDPSAEGAVAVIPGCSPASESLAKAVLNRLSALCYAKPEPIAMPEHPLLAARVFPIVLVEIGFLSNPTEASRLGTEAYRDAVARAIAAGIHDYLSAPPVTPALPTDLKTRPPS